METRKPPKVNVGSTSIVVIFSVLCLTVFAVLSLMTANNESKLSQKSVKAVSDYYVADTACAEIAQELFDLKASGAPDSDLILRAKELSVSTSVDAAFILFSYEVEIDDKQELYVELLIADDDAKIVTWQARNSSAWQADKTISVWDGN